MSSVLIPSKGSDEDSLISGSGTGSGSAVGSGTDSVSCYDYGTGCVYCKDSGTACD